MEYMLQTSLCMMRFGGRRRRLLQLQLQERECFAVQAGHLQYKMEGVIRQQEVVG
jgi:hypothetical protein